jgi:hypothetical protein
MDCDLVDVAVEVTRPAATPGAILGADGKEKTVTLNGWHLPTGYFPLEEVIRFCIADLRVEALSPRSQLQVPMVPRHPATKTDRRVQ